MSKKVLVISTSLRKNSNSETLADAFLAGAKASGNQVEKISLRGKKIAFCQGCLACQNTQKCVIEDDAVAIAVALSVVNNYLDDEVNTQAKAKFDSIFGDGAYDSL